MGNNNFTETFADGLALTQAELETALKSLTPDISNTTQMTQGSTSGQVLTSNGNGAAASFQAVSDPLGPFALRNYGLAAAASSGTLKVSLKNNTGGDPSGSSSVDFTYTTNGAASATYSAVKVSTATSITISNSATLGFTATSTNRVYVYGYYNTSTSSVKMAVSARSDFDNGAATTTFAMSASSDGSTVMYATAVLTVTTRLLGWFEAALNSSKAWQAPTKVNITNNADLSNSVTANIITQTAPTRSVAGTVGSGGVAVSLSSGAFSTSSTSATAVTNLTVTITTNGRPVVVKVIPDGTAGNHSTITANKSSANNTNLIETRWRIKRGSTVIALSKVSLEQSNSSTLTFFSEIPVTVVETVDTPAAGTYTYSVEVFVTNAAGEIDFNYAKLVAYEL